MMLELAVPMLNIVSFVYDIATPLRRTNVITTVKEALLLNNVTSNDYVTVHSIITQLENIGVNNLLYVNFNLNWNVTGQGSARWQISGDGGTTWNTITEVLNFNHGTSTSYLRLGAGEWITTVDNGDDKLQVRFQIKATSGTVNSELIDDSFMTILNRISIRGL